MCGFTIDPKESCVIPGLELLRAIYRLRPETKWLTNMASRVTLYVFPRQQVLLTSLASFESEILLQSMLLTSYGASPSPILDHCVRGSSTARSR